MAQTARDAEDARLLEAGDHATLLASYYGIIVQRCKARLRSDDDAHEVAHRVIDRLIAELARGKQYRYPYRVIVHNVIEWTLKDWFTGRPIEVELPAEWDTSGENPYVEFEQDFDLARRLEGLPPRQRQVAELRWRRGLEIEEIAAELDMTRNAVDQALHNAHKKLRETLDG